MAMPQIQRASDTTSEGLKWRRSCSTWRYALLRVCRLSGGRCCCFLLCYPPSCCCSCRYNKCSFSRARWTEPKFGLQLWPYQERKRRRRDGVTLSAITALHFLFTRQCLKLNSALFQPAVPLIRESAETWELCSVLMYAETVHKGWISS